MPLQSAAIGGPHRPFTSSRRGCERQRVGLLASSGLRMRCKGNDTFARKKGEGNILAKLLPDLFGNIWQSNVTTLSNILSNLSNIAKYGANNSWYFVSKAPTIFDILSTIGQLLVNIWPRVVKIRVAKFDKPWSTFCQRGRQHLWTIEVDLVQKCGNLECRKNCIYCRNWVLAKNRLRYTREWALQSLLQGPYTLWLHYLDSSFTAQLVLRRSPGWPSFHRRTSYPKFW